MNSAFLESFLTGSGLLYLVLAVLAIGALVVRGRTDDTHVRRRATLLVGLVLLFAGLQFVLARIPPETTGYQVISVALLVVGLLVFLLAATVIVVDFLLVRKLRFEIPNILRDATVFTLFFVGVLLIFYYRTDVNVTGLFTTSAVLSLVIGLALQDTLGNVFSGLALQTERSFNVGDWVRFGDREGVVVDISWRATKLRTRSNELVIIPNILISKETVVNYSAPTRIHAVHEAIGTHYKHPPAAVIAALEEAAGQTEGILKKPAVDVRTKAFGDFAITYDVKYWIKDYADLEEIDNDFMTRIWYAFKRRGIEIPFPIRDVYLREVTSETEQAAEEADDERIYQHLRRVSMFEALSEEEARDLARRVRVEDYFQGETVMRQGEPGDSLYIVDEGKVEIVVSQNGRSETVAELGSQAMFGEMALMTGAARKATVVTAAPTHFFVIDRDSFRKTLQSNPAIADRISETLATREQQLESTRATLDRSRDSNEEQKRILSRIRDFFGFGESRDE